MTVISKFTRVKKAEALEIIEKQKLRKLEGPYGSSFHVPSKSRYMLFEKSQIGFANKRGGYFFDKEFLKEIAIQSIEETYKELDAKSCSNNETTSYSHLNLIQEHLAHLAKQMVDLDTKLQKAIDQIETHTKISINTYALCSKLDTKLKELPKDLYEIYKPAIGSSDTLIKYYNSVGIKTKEMTAEQKKVVEENEILLESKLDKLKKWLRNE